MPTFPRPVNVLQSRRTAEIITVFRTVGAAECAFGNQLSHSLTKVAPEVNAARVRFPLGAAYLGANFSGVTLIAVRGLYLDGCSYGMCASDRLSGHCGLMSLAGERKKINVDQVTTDQVLARVTKKQVKVRVFPMGRTQKRDPAQVMKR